MLSSHVKRSPLLWLHIKSYLSQRKVKWFGISSVFRTLHGRLEIPSFSSRVENYFNTLVLKIISTLEEKFRISARPCNILYLHRTESILLGTVIIYRLRGGGGVTGFSAKDSNI